MWKESLTLAKDIMQLVKGFPAHERYALASQLSRSACSIPSNIAEGSARKSDKSFVNFLEIALGSAFELETQLIIAADTNYVEAGDLDSRLIRVHYVQNMLYNLIEKLENEF